MDIGFIGLGNMGAPMVRRLVAAGHNVTGYDVMESAMASLSDVKMNVSNDILMAASEQEVVISMLPNGEALIRVVESILPVMSEGACFIDCSTVDISTTRRVAKLLKDAAIHALDAPVSGGVGGAVAGTLTFMVGGSEASFAIGNPLFKLMGQRVIHCGIDGAGQAAKICNNMILGVTMIATSEAFALADDLALDRQKLFDVVSTSSGNSWSMSTYCPAPGIGPKSPSDNNYLPGFSASLMLKDLALSQEAAAIHGTPTKTGQLALKIYQEFVESGNGGTLDFSAILQDLASRAKDK
jgi:3-hydroxyisobutyrate dehydrogenase